MPVFVRASRRAKAYVRGGRAGFNKVDKGPLEKSENCGNDDN